MLFNVTYSERCRGLQSGGGWLNRLLASVWCYLYTVMPHFVAGGKRGQLTEYDEYDFDQLKPFGPLFSSPRFN